MPLPPAAFDSARRRAVFGLAGLGIASASASVSANVSASGLAGGTPRIIRALVESWPPYLSPRPDGTVRGLDAELLEAICARAGYRVSWVRAPLERRKRRYHELLSDQFDVIFSATPVAKNLDQVMYTRSYRHEIMMVAAPAEHDPLIDTLRNFDDVLRKRVRLLHVDADGLGKAFEAARPALRKAGLLVRYPTSRQGVEMLRAERADLILGDALDLQEQSRQIGFPLVRQPYGHDEQPVSLMLSRQRLDEADLRRINQAITDLEQRGELAAIRARYAIERPPAARQAGAASAGFSGSTPMDFRPSR